MHPEAPSRSQDTNQPATGGHLDADPGAARAGELQRPMMHHQEAVK